MESDDGTTTFKLFLKIMVCCSIGKFGDTVDFDGWFFLF